MALVIHYGRFLKVKFDVLRQNYAPMQTVVHTFCQSKILEINYGGHYSYFVLALCFSKKKNDEHGYPDEK